MTRISNILLFKKYHNLYPNHGYRWLNAKIKLDLGLVLSDRYAHRVCKYTGIASISKRFKFKKPGEQFKIYANLLSADMNIDGPYQCVVSDMTAFWCQGTYYELTDVSKQNLALYMAKVATILAPLYHQMKDCINLIAFLNFLHKLHLF